MLVVDDDPLVRRTVERMLVREGFHVTTADSGADALAALAAHAFDLLISDVMMDDVEGPVLLASAREAVPDLRVLFMSGETPENLPVVGVDPATVPFVAKPFTAATLLGAVRRALATG